MSKITRNLHIHIHFFLSAGMESRWEDCECQSNDLKTHKLLIFFSLQKILTTERCKTKREFPSYNLSRSRKQWFMKIVLDDSALDSHVVPWWVCEEEKAVWRTAFVFLALHRNVAPMLFECFPHYSPSITVKTLSARKARAGESDYWFFKDAVQHLRPPKPGEPALTAAALHCPRRRRCIVPTAGIKGGIQLSIEKTRGDCPSPSIPPPATSFNSFLSSICWLLHRTFHQFGPHVSVWALDRHKQMKTC